MSSFQKYNAFPINKNIFETFNLPFKFNIDKEDLKRRYFTKMKEIHPDLKKAEDFENANKLNKYYNLLKDDYKRAGLFHQKNEIIDSKNNQNDFLSKLIDIEDSIRHNSNVNSIKDSLDKKIEECKNNYDSLDFYVKWGYYKRLREMCDS